MWDKRHLHHQHCESSIIRSFVNEEIDLLTGDVDHKTLILELRLLCGNPTERSFKRKPLYDRVAAQTAKQQGHISMTEEMPWCPWETDVNTHWGFLRDHIQQKVVHTFPCKKRIARQQYFSSHAWDLLCQRKGPTKRTQSITESAEPHTASDDVWRMDIQLKRDY